MFRSVAAVLSLLAGGALLAADPAPPKGFTALFNGKDLAGWHGWAIHAKGGSPADLAKLSPEERQKKTDEWTADAKKHWSVENSELVNDGHGAYLATDKDYGDIELLIEYKTVPKADSGIYLRSTPQVQIWDYTEEAKFKLGADKGSGGLWNNPAGSSGKDPLVKADKPFGEWNKFRILQVGDKTTIYLNDQLVVDHARMHNFWRKDEPLAKTGKILLQTHGGEIRWRNVHIREIPADEANEILRKKAGSGFKPVFDGKTFAGWSGALQNYEVKDGAIVCKPKKGGVLFTNDRFADFAVQLEYKVPPGGNNGLAIRYPGKGQGSYDGMCELQILDDDAPKYAKLDPRQFTGSPYGMAAAKRGYGRPAGEWNFMMVTVQGPKILVELNGTTTVQSDLSQVTEFMGNRAHPGKDLKEGHFGFCGHNDPVSFRSVAIKPLDTR
jgi:hypothetical protein